MKNFNRVHADIYLDRICRNISRTREIVNKDSKIMAIVKADAYGHGAIAVAKALDEQVDAYGVAMIEEAVELRENGIAKPILILGYTPEAEIDTLVKYDVMTAVYHLETAKWISKEAKKQGKIAKIHIKLDTGMGRIGFALNEESVKAIKEISELEGIDIDGCFTHFAKADEENLQATYTQLEKYDAFVGRLEEAGIHIPVKHVCNSAGIMMLPQANKSMVRSGISTYGMYPSEEVDKTRLMLEPAMEVKSYVSFVKELEAGEGISYGGTFVTTKKTKVATVPVGYGDGYPRALSSKGYVLIKGKKAPILGRVCMDQFMVDVSEIEAVNVGETVTLIGVDGDQSITVEEISAMSYSFNYEFVCDIGKRIPRVYYKDGKRIASMTTQNIYQE